MLLHSSYHSVHHHEDTLPHLSHGYGTLLVVLVLVHVVAISYWIYLLSRPGPPSRARPKRPSELKLVRCEDDWQVRLGISQYQSINNGLWLLSTKCNLHSVNVTGRLGGASPRSVVSASVIVVFFIRRL